MQDQKIIGSVKVMRSYDYCHFEIQLSSIEEKSLDEIDDKRKEAMRLVDKAVEQYKKARAFEKWKYESNFGYERLVEKARKISNEIPESEWTPEQKAVLKLMDDINYYRKNEYDYQDDWDDDYPEEETDIPY